MMKLKNMIRGLHSIRLAICLHFSQPSIPYSTLSSIFFLTIPLAEGLKKWSRINNKHSIPKTQYEIKLISNNSLPKRFSHSIHKSDFLVCKFQGDFRILIKNLRNMLERPQGSIGILY
jgi:hypothetical protein